MPVRVGFLCRLPNQIKAVMMKVTNGVGTVTRIYIEGIQALDPVTVLMEDMQPGVAASPLSAGERSGRAFGVECQATIFASSSYAQMIAISPTTYGTISGRRKRIKPIYCASFQRLNLALFKLNRRNHVNWMGSTS